MSVSGDYGELNRFKMFNSLIPLKFLDKDQDSQSTHIDQLLLTSLQGGSRTNPPDWFTLN